MKTRWIYPNLIKTCSNETQCACGILFHFNRRFAPIFFFENSGYKFKKAESKRLFKWNSMPAVNWVSFQQTFFYPAHSFKIADASSVISFNPLFFQSLVLQILETKEVHEQQQSPTCTPWNVFLLRLNMGEVSEGRMPLVVASNNSYLFFFTISCAFSTRNQGALRCCLQN